MARSLLGALAALTLAVTTTASAQAASVDEGTALPRLPDAGVLVDTALTGNTAWALLDGPADGRDDATLWSTPSDGSGSWTAYLARGDEAPLNVHSIVASEGTALLILDRDSVGGSSPQIGLRVLRPGGSRLVDGTPTTTQLGAGGRLLLTRYPDGVSEVSTPT